MRDSLGTSCTHLLNFMMEERLAINEFLTFLSEISEDFSIVTDTAWKWSSKTSDGDSPYFECICIQKERWRLCDFDGRPCAASEHAVAWCIHAHILKLYLIASIEMHCSLALANRNHPVSFPIVEKVKKNT